MPSPLNPPESPTVRELLDQAHIEALTTVGALIAWADGGRGSGPQVAIDHARKASALIDQANSSDFVGAAS